MIFTATYPQLLHNLGQLVNARQRQAEVALTEW